MQYIRTSILLGAFSFAVKQKYIPFNPITATEAPRVEKYQVTTLDREQVQRLLDAAKDSPIEVLLLIAVTLGLRKGELDGIRFRDINFEKGTLRIAVAVQRVNRTLQLVPPKTASSYPRLATSRGDRTSVAPMCKQYDEDRKKRGKEWNEHGLVFPTSTGRIRDPRNLVVMFKRILKKAGLPEEDIRLHNLRHTAATLMIEEGIHPRVVMELLGHSNITVTMGTYGHVSPGM